jgi:nucleotide-binding universal stress UspA family protein
MRIARILCATDFSPGSEAALRVAVRFANDLDAELVIAHAWHVPVSAGQGYLFPSRMIDEIVEDAKRGLESAARNATALGAHRVRTELLSGVAWTAITEHLAANPSYELVVMGTHGRTGLLRVVLGSVAEKVVRHAPCSVLVVRSDAAQFANVLVPVDFSEASDPAIEVASQLVQPGGSGVTLLHIVEVPLVGHAGRQVTEVVDDLDTRARALLAESAAKIATRVAVPVQTRTREGRSAGAGVLEAIDEDPAIDLVIVGSHGHTGIKRALLGSVAEKVVRHARCPVLVARRRA